MLDRPFEYLSGVVGAPPDHLKLIFTLLASYPLGHIYIRLPSSKPAYKDIFSIVTSCFFLLALFKMYWGFIQLLADSVVVWLIVKSGVGVGKDGKGQGWMPWVVFGIIMGHLTINHVYRALVAIPLSVIEITGSQMVLAMKLITFAWNVEDGRHSHEELDQAQDGTRVEKIPSLTRFLGFCFFYPSIMAGPPSDFATYNALVENTLFTSPPASNASSALAASESKAATQTHKRARVPALRKTVAYQKLALGLMFLAIYALYGGKASHERVLDGKWWYAHSKLWRFGFIQLAGFMARAKYYAVWTVAEGACILTGLGFNGYDPKTGKTLWNRVSNVLIWNIETAQSYKVLFDSWNCGANVWLRDTIYKRVTPPGKKPGFASTLITFLTSAFWHGVAPGYYCKTTSTHPLSSASPTDIGFLFCKSVAFVTAGFCTSLGRPFRHLIRPFFLPKPPQKSSPLKTIYDFLGWFFVQSTLNYLVVPFFLLDLKSALTGWHRMGWYGHILIFGAYGALQLGGRAWLVKLNKKMGRAPSRKAIPGEARKKEF